MDISTPLDPDVDPTSVLAVIRHLMDFLTVRNVEREKELLEPQNVLIEPDLEDISSSDFEKVADAISIGVSATEGSRASLQELTVSEETFQVWVRQQRRPGLGEVHIGLVVEEDFSGGGLFGLLFRYDRLAMNRKAGWYIGFSAEAGNTYFAGEPISIDSLLGSGSVFFGAGTPLGPILLGYGYTEGGQDRFFLLIGRNFLSSRRRSLGSF